MTWVAIVMAFAAVAGLASLIRGGNVYGSVAMMAIGSVFAYQAWRARTRPSAPSAPLAPGARPWDR